MNTKQLDAVGDIVGQMLAEALVPLRRQLLELSERVAALPAGPTSADLAEAIDVVSAKVDNAVAQAVKALPEPDKVPASWVAWLDERIKSAAHDTVLEVDRRIEAIPFDDMKAAAVEQVQPLVAQAVEAAVKALPAPKDGIGLAGAMIDRDGELQITMTDGTVKSLGPVVGKSLESFAMEYLPETHEVRIKAACAGREQEVRFDAGGIRMGESDRGYWRDGVKAKALEAYSYDGCLWVARAATTAKPSAESQDWVLAARQGRPGAPGKDLTAPRAPEPIKVSKP